MRPCTVQMIPHDRKPRTVREIAEILATETGRATTSCQDYVRGLVRSRTLEPVAGHAHKPMDWSGNSGRISLGHAAVCHRYILAIDPAHG